MSACAVCKSEPIFGSPSAARWKGPDGHAYCSMHFINKFGHGEPLVKIEGFEPPKSTSKPKAKAKAPKEVKA